METITSKQVLALVVKTVKAEVKATSVFVDIAIQSGSVESFQQVVDTAFKAFRANDGGVAEKAGALVGAKGKYTIPGSLSNARSVMKLALEYGIDLTTDGTPRAFNAIKLDVKESKDNAVTDAEKEQEVNDSKAAKELAAAIKKSPELTAILECKAMLAALTETVTGLEGAAGEQPSPMSVILDVHASLRNACGISTETATKIGKVALKAVA